MVLISLTMMTLAVLHCLEANPVVVNDDYERKYEIQEDSGAGLEHSSPYQHSSLLNVRSAQSPSQFTTYPYQAFSSQLNPYSQYSQQLQQLQSQPSQLAAAQQGNHQYLAALQQYYAASKRPQSFAPSTAAAYNQVPIAQQAAAQLPQAGYQQPLGALYSAAPDVSQFQFSGNGVNYAF